MPATKGSRVPTRDPLSTFMRLVAPAAHLVSKQPEMGEPAAKKPGFHDHATRCTGGVRAGPRGLDGEAAHQDAHLERRVVEKSSGRVPSRCA